jgi:TRAP-type C4-dicarboxylate transport system permease small subunit
MKTEDESWLGKLTHRVVVIGFTGLVLIGLLTMLDAVLRHLNLPRIPGFGDLGEVVFAIVIASCFPAGLRNDQNIRITLLGDRLAPGLKPWLEVLQATLTLVVFAAIAVQFVLMTWDLQVGHRVTSTIEMPVAPWWWIATIVMGISVPVQAGVVVQRWLDLKGPATNRPGGA